MAIPDTSGHFWGSLVVDDEGRTKWPFHQMAVGDWFTIRWSERSPESVRKIASVRGAQLRRRFGVTSKSDEHPGATVVWRKPDEGRGEGLGNSWLSKRTRFDFDGFQQLLWEEYQLDANEIRWDLVRQPGQRLEIQAERTGDDPRALLQMTGVDGRYMVRLRAESIIIENDSHRGSFDLWLREHYDEVMADVREAQVKRLLS